jgi:hypothetical protein
MTARALILLFTLVTTAPASAHPWGRLTRPLASPPGPCAEKTDHPKTRAYLRALLEKLVAGSPELFKSPFEAIQFCLKIVVDPRYDGASVSPSREISVGTGLLTKKDDDAKLAAVLAHELSHMLLQHAGAFSLRTAIPFVLSDDKTYIRLLEKKKALDTERQDLELRWRMKRSRRWDILHANPSANVAGIDREIDALSRRIDEVKPSYLEALKAANAREKLLFPPEKKLAWEEQEADEAGNEIYRQACLEPTGFVRALRGLVPAEQRPACADEIAGAVAGKNPPPSRITGSIDLHPRECWRVYDIEVLESARHESQLRELCAGKTIPPAQPIPDEVLEEIPGPQ